ncbi:Transcription factor GRAS domain-containing protein [Dioscorea alata]|uniref:Transcription factor GRAS domain-containing protein n=2 Tax=Dioscorea alata TaxID=55571 RepID=A0ACB7UNZ8_DIOAL|nr:Transcription factor GRAS domain-containing protein [Dioscorea alata]
MDMQQFFGSEFTDADFSYNHSSVITPAYSEWPVGSIKFNLGISPNSPLSSQFDCETLSARSNSQEQYSPSNYSGNSFRQAEISFQDGIQGHHSSAYISSGQSIQHALQELETVLMAPDSDEATTSTNTELDERKIAQVPKSRSRTSSQVSGVQVSNPHRQYPLTSYQGSYENRPEKRLKEVAVDIPLNNMKQWLVKCAEALSENKIVDFEALVEKARGVVSITGEPIQRLGAYIIEGLVARHESSGTNIYRALKCRAPESNELLSYMRILYDICPYFKFGYMAANGAIAEALRNENRIHIIDFQIAQGTQWITLIQALAARPGGPPHVRITGIDDPVSEYARGENLQLVGKMLYEMSKKFNIPLEFNALSVYGPNVTRDMLDIRPDEALAVNFTLQLHHTPDESVDVNNPRDGLLRMVKGLSPKVTTLVEHESNSNTTPFLTRFVETLDYYSAMFESIDATLARDSKERISVEQHCLAKDIVNMIACEGKERVERYELLGKWRSRLTMAGFKPYPLSSYVNSVIRTLLACYSDKYTLAEKDGAMLLGWKNRSLISASAWH